MKTDILQVCAFLRELAKHVFINTEIIANAPKEYLWAGIGDTYAKYYEVSISARGEKLEHLKRWVSSLAVCVWKRWLSMGHRR